jgi:hypothetical protein
MSAQNSKSSPNKLVIVVCLIAFLLVLVYAFRDNKGTSGAQPNAGAGAKSEHADARTLTKPQPSTVTATNETPEEPESNAQRDYLIEDFRDGKRDWSAYKLSNLQMSEQGIGLVGGATNGVLESPSLALKLPSNMVAPLWKKQGPECAGLKVEMAISSDNQVWSPWYPLEDTGDDINPLYPDGSPNPNYGYVPGTSVSLGLSLSSFTKYRFTFSKSEGCAQGPTLQAVRLYHLDSTLGEGTIATSFPPGPPTPEEAAQQLQESNNTLPPANTVP